MINFSEYRKWAKDHPNFMTPHIVKLTSKNNTIVEISSGTDFNNRPVYGVTKVKHDNGKYTIQSHVNRCFQGSDARGHAFKYAKKVLSGSI